MDLAMEGFSATHSTRMVAARMRTQVGLVPDLATKIGHGEGRDSRALRDASGHVQTAICNRL